jgi:MoxR-like ATPase
MKHARYEEIHTLVKNKIAVLLTGDAGSGKTTLAKQLAEDMKLHFYSISLTRQTTLSHLLGFISVNGTYVESSLRRCFQHGGLMLLDEIDAGDPNVLLSLNTIENGYISFPDALVECHQDFRLVATSNPQDQHQFYTGRAKLDAATLDRFDIVEIERDDDLEKSLVDDDAHARMQILRKILSDMNSSKRISMRDAIRYQQRKNLDLLSEDFVFRLVDKNELVLEKYNEAVKCMPKFKDQADCATADELFELLTARSKHK